MAGHGGAWPSFHCCCKLLVHVPSHATVLAESQYWAARAQAGLHCRTCPGHLAWT